MHRKKNTKNPLNYYLFKSKKNHGDCVRNESARGKKLDGGGRQTPPPPSLIRVNLQTGMFDSQQSPLNLYPSYDEEYIVVYLLGKVLHALALILKSL